MLSPGQQLHPERGMIMGITFVDFLRDRLSLSGDAVKLGRILNIMHLVWQVRRERNQLAMLSRAELVEMGIHPGDAQKEAARGLFDLPKSRLEKL